MNRYFVTGIDTNVGKTVVSAILVKAFNAHYWKPIQSGDLENTDSMKVQKLSQVKNNQILPETYKLQTPASPHYAAQVENVQIKLSDFNLPKIEDALIIEGAGGLMVPINDQHLMIDLIQKMGLPAILVSRNYLGSINHTLLSIAALKQYHIPLKGIIMIGDKNEASENAIEHIGGISILHHIPISEKLNEAFVSEQALEIIAILENLN
jgi:dethiobiotin synthetase